MGLRLVSVVVLFWMGSLVFAATSSSTSSPVGGVAPPPGMAVPQPMVLSKTPGDFLPKEPFAGTSVPGFYNEIPPNIEPAVRCAAEDNFTTAIAILDAELKKAANDKEKARILMWLGIVKAQLALDYEAAAGGWGPATTATLHIREAIRLDPEVFKATDVARALGQMVGSGWAPETPENEIEKAKRIAEEEKSPIHFYYAGVVHQRLTQRSWGFVDTRVEDEKSLSFLAKCVVRDPTRYETWPTYLSTVGRLGMGDLITSDGEKMYRYFKNLRTPLFVDQGPAALYLKTRLDWNDEKVEAFLNDIKKQQPDNPFPDFTLAQIAMSTSPTLALERLQKFLADVEKGTIKLLPREQGYRASALYKIGFIQQNINQTNEALATYEKLKTISPHYAETDFNISTTYRRMAEAETTGPKKVEYLEKAITAARHQQDYDYQQRAAGKADGFRRDLSALLRRVKKEMEPGGGQTSGTAAATTGTPAASSK